MTNVTQLNDIKSSESIELMDRLEQAIIDTPNLTPIEIVGALEMVKANHTRSHHWSTNSTSSLATSGAFSCPLYCNQQRSVYGRELQTKNVD